MDIDINKVLVVGALDEIGELRTFPSGSTLCSITVVTVERFTKRGGEQGEKKTWHKVTAWGELAKRIHGEFSRGSRVVVEGRLSRRSYEKEGETRWITEIVANSCNPVGYQQPSQSSYSGGGQPSYASHQQKPHRAAPAARSAAAPATEPPPIPDGDDDLPF